MLVSSNISSSAVTTKRGDDMLLLFHVNFIGPRVSFFWSGNYLLVSMLSVRMCRLFRFAAASIGGYSHWKQADVIAAADELKLCMVHSLRYYQCPHYILVTATLVCKCWPGLCVYQMPSAKCFAPSMESTKSHFREFRGADNHNASLSSPCM